MTALPSMLGVSGAVEIDGLGIGVGSEDGGGDVGVGHSDFTHQKLIL